MKWIKASERLPDNSKEVFGKDEKGRKWVVLYAHKHKIEVSDYEDELDEETIDVHNDAIYLKPGWYELCEQHGGSYDEIYFPRNIVEWWDESPSPSLQEAAEAYAVGEVGEGSNNVNDPFHPQYKILNDAWVAGWNAREAQQGGPTVSKKEMVKTPEFGGIGHIPAGQYDTVTFCAETYAMGEFNHHHHCEEHMIAYNGFLSGVNWIFGHMPKLSAPLLTRELFDKIWEAATRWADVGNIDNNPDKETFYKSLNL